jgi:hypothetical protein
MFTGRGKKAAMAAGSSILVAAASLTVVPMAAAVTGTAPTSTAVAAHPSTIVAGRALTIVAKVTPVTGVASTARRAMRFRVHKASAATGNVGVPTGTVTFTITGQNSATADCTSGDAVAMHHGRATCKIATEVLTHVGSPYTIKATYSGDTNFAGSVGTTSETVNKSKSNMKLRIDSKPMSGTPNEVTANVRAGPGGSLLTGKVLFAVAATPPTPRGKRICLGGDSQPLAVTGNVGTAVCILQSGWFIVPKPTRGTPHPKGAWQVSATYSGDGNFLPKTAAISGHSRT